jgi:hypothetical protein
MFLSYTTLAVALSLSVIAAYYSIAGLAAIFAAAVIPIIVMGSILELGKVVVTLWLHEYWRQCRFLMKAYLVPAVAVLMLITSMGIFGFLSKAHTDQTLVSGDVQARIAIYDEKIKTERDNINANRKALKQLDDAVDQVMGRSTDERGAERSVQIRRGQQAERGRLLKEIEQSQKRITALNEERAPIAAEVRKVEAEVGPIKYIAALVYGDSADANLLEAAVRWVIILLVVVFDPLAIMMLLAATESLKWERQRVLELLKMPKPESVQEDQPEPVPEPETPDIDRYSYLRDGAKMFFTSIKPLVARPENKPEELAKATESNFPDIEIDPEDTPEVQAAMRRWKAENPDDTLKHQRSLLARGVINELPWMRLIPDAELPQQPQTGFGLDFPANPSKGDVFVRIDRAPNRVYKFNGNTWYEVDKTVTDSYTYDNAYIDHLIEKIDQGQYDPDLLSDSEREQVTQRLQQNK